MNAKLRKHLPAFISVGAYLFQLRPVEGGLGHDYYHYFARAFIGLENIFRNGVFSLPYFTAHQGGGLPYLADPQILYFTLPQWLGIWWDPLVALYFSYGVFLFLGYFGFFFLLEKEGVSSNLSVLGGLIFLWNGFGFANLLVGHVSHHLYFLVPWCIYFFIQKPSASGTVVLVSYLYWSGAKHVLLILFFIYLLFLPLAFERFGWRIVKMAILTTCGLVLSVSGKAILEFRYAEHFIRHGVVQPSLSWVATVKNYYLSLPTTPPSLSFGKAKLGCWEYVGYISVTVWMGLFQMKSKKYLLWVIPLVVLACGGSALLPLFRLYHMPIKWLAAPIPFFIFWSMKSLKVSHAFSYFLIGFVCFEGMLTSQYFFRQHWARGFFYDPNVAIELKTAGAFHPVSKITDIPRNDIVQLRFGHTSLKVFEPLLGYHRERFSPQLEVGKTQFTHPGCLLFSKELGCTPWQKIQDERERERFSRGETMGEWVPLWVRRLLLWNGIFLIAFAGFFASNISTLSKIRFTVSSDGVFVRR